MDNRIKKALSGLAAAATLSAVGLASAPMALAATGSASSTANSATKAPMLVALGDSITFGYNLPDTNHNSVPSQSAYPYLIGKADHMKVSDLGIPGWTSTDLLNALSSANFDRVIQSANVVVIDIGSNDLLHLSGPLLQQAQANPTAPIQLTQQQQAAFQQAITTFGGNITKIVAGVRKMTNAPILLYNLYDPFPPGTGVNTVTEQLEAVENGLIAQVSASVPNVTVVDAHKAFAGQQTTFVRIAEGDVHPTLAGQGVLAQIGETALLPDLANLSKMNSSAGATSLLAGSVTPAGGTVSGSLYGTNVTLSVPQGTVNQGTEVDVTSQPAASLMNLAPAHMQVVAEEGLNFMSGTKFSGSYKLTLANPAIPAAGAVYQVTANGQLVAVPEAKVTAGQAVIPANQSGDFVVLAPAKAPVTGVTKPVTGLPFLQEGSFAAGLLLAGAGLVWMTRRKAGNKA
ncbi:SGNH/GDSL hydrolase family protein [Alicyclobacillus ferrooxydans]|uniref:SGNH/GDSL hydrolase family protein n=1 Tax=Alicyclobacillus ferrooxydans TaxID=471514 RepID=UPI0006D55F02|nr:SGNH/GDSL hydrolase family protein [Alicyclobacillus ferrooxydans]